MNCKEVRLDFKYCKKGRFFRTLLVNETINLVDLGCTILTAFNGTFEHCFYFKSNGKNYNPSVFMEDAFENDVLMDNYTLKDLGKKFEFCYDTGDGYDFVATVKDCDVELEGDDCALIDGAGQGIWEDNICTLIAYLEGELDNVKPTEYVDENGYCMPWNFEINEYSDFDTAFDLEEEMFRFDEEYEDNRCAYKEDMNIDFEETEEVDEEEEKMAFIEILAGLYEVSMEIVKNQIKSDDFVKETYERLLQKHKPKESKEMIAKEFLFAQAKAATKEDILIDIKKYRKALEKLN